MNFFSELKRRNVFKVAAAYIIVAWLLLQVSDTLVPALHLPEWFHSGVAFLLIMGFPVAMIFPCERCFILSTISNPVGP